VKQNEKEIWMKEFTEFEKSPDSNAKVPQTLFSKIQARLFPNPWVVFGKVAGLHAVVGFLSLAICNQFGLNPFNTPYSLSDLFMKTAGHSFCMVLCGVVFVSMTYVLANTFLTLEEIESIKRYEWLQLSILSLASLAAFYFLGAELVGTFVGLWLVGALVGGFLSIEGSVWVRQKMI
jgi:hypothetical protein